MKRKRVAAALGLIAAVLVALGLLAGGVRSLHATVVPTPRITYPGLPVSLELRVENDGWFSEDIPEEIAPWDFEGSVEFMRPDGTTDRLGSPFSCGTGYEGPTPMPVAPGEVYRRVNWVSYAYNGPHAVFDKPGLYRVRWRFNLPDRPSLWARWFGRGGERDEVVTPWAEVIVRAPEGRETKAAPLFVAQAGDLEYWHEITDFGDWDRDETRRRLADCVARYPDTLYGKYALYLLAEDSSHLGHDASRRDEDEAARRHYTDALLRYLRLHEAGAPANIEVSLVMDIARSYERLGQIDRALEWASRLSERRLPEPRSGFRDSLLDRLRPASGG